MTPPDNETDTRARLLEVGAQAFAGKGFNSCGLAEILEWAGLLEGSFHHRFASKGARCSRA